MKQERIYLFRNTVYQHLDGSAKTVFSGPGELDIGPAAEFGGGGQSLDPEEMFVAAINGCLMNTFYYFTRKFQLEIFSYDSQAEGRLEKQSDGFLFTSVTVRTKIQVTEADMVEKVREAGRLAEKYCLVSHSVSCPVTYQVDIEFSQK